MALHRVTITLVVLVSLIWGTNGRTAQVKRVPASDSDTATTSFAPRSFFLTNIHQDRTFFSRISIDPTFQSLGIALDLLRPTGCNLSCEDDISPIATVISSNNSRGIRIVEALEAAAGRRFHFAQGTWILAKSRRHATTRKLAIDSESVRSGQASAEQQMISHLFQSICSSFTSAQWRTLIETGRLQFHDFSPMQWKDVRQLLALSLSDRALPSLAKPTPAAFDGKVEFRLAEVPGEKVDADWMLFVTWAQQAASSYGLPIMTMYLRRESSGAFGMAMSVSQSRYKEYSELKKGGIDPHEIERKELKPKSIISWKYREELPRKPLFDYTDTDRRLGTIGAALASQSGRSVLMYGEWLNRSYAGKLSGLTFSDVFGILESQSQLKWRALGDVSLLVRVAPKERQ